MTISIDSIDHIEAPAAVDDAAVEAFADRVFADLLGAMNIYATTIGARLGWYDALAVTSRTSTELAEATATDERYAREWLEHQTVAGYIDVVDAGAPALDRRYSLPAAHAEVLANEDSLAFMAPFATSVSAFGSNIDALIEAYRTGDGFGWHDHGDGARCGQAAGNRPMFLQQLAQVYLAEIDGARDALNTGGRVADVGCGLGWSSIGIALHHPDVTVDGYDVDAPSVEMANANAAAAGVADRVRFHHADVATVAADSYDLVLALECIHDMPDPVSVLASMRSMAGADGTVVIMDERVGETFTGEPDPVEQAMYGFSLLCCLADGRCAEESVATGTVMRPSTLEAYALDAGFSGVDVLDLEHDTFRFYRLLA